jgi:hypothetical protein
MSPRPNGSNGGTWLMPAGIAMTAVVALLQAFWGVAYSGLVSNQNRIEEQLNKRAQLIEAQFLRVREHDEFSKRLDAQIKKDEDLMLTLAPRNEVDARLSTNANALQQMRTELAEFKRDFGQTYSVKDALSQIQQRLERLESWTKGAKPQ